MTRCTDPAWCPAPPRATEGTRSAPAGLEFGRERQLPQGVAPHALELSRQATERLWPRAVEPMAPVPPDLDETGRRQRAELQRHRPERDIRKGRVDGTGRELLVPQQPQDFPPPR